MESLLSQKDRQHKLPWLYSKLLPLTLEEQDYYLRHSDPPDPPEPGWLLLLRMPYTNVVKIIYPAIDGETVNQSVFIAHDCPDALLKFEKAGIPKEKMERVFDYLWNFSKAYVRTPNWKPKIAPKGAPKKEPAGLELLSTLKEAIELLTKREQKRA